MLPIGSTRLPSSTEIKYEADGQNDIKLEYKQQPTEEENEKEDVLHSPSEFFYELDECTNGNEVELELFGLKKELKEENGMNNSEQNSIVNPNEVTTTTTTNQKQKSFQANENNKTDNSNNIEISRMECKRLKQDDQSAPDEIPVENVNMNPLNMEDTLTLILQSLEFDGSFLKSIRFLSKIWDHVALKQFLKTNFLRIPLNFNTDFPSSDDKKSALTHIKKLIERVGTIQNISINDDHSNDMEIFTILQDQIKWEKITQIRIHFHFKINVLDHPNMIKNVKFIEEIMIKCPHLKFLDIPPQSDRSFSQEIGLSLMEFCINLKKNQNLTITNLAAIVFTKRDSDLVVGFSQTGVRVLNFLAKPMYQLKNDFASEIPGLVKAFEKIIESNKNNLISLGLNDRREIFLPDFKIPVKIPQLKILHLVADRRSQLKFPDGFQFRENFPNLRELNFNLDGMNWPGRNHFWINIFQNQEPCKSVKKLRLSSLGKVEEEIFQVFPEIEELRFCERVVVTSPFIFQFLQRNCHKLKIIGLEIPDDKFEWHGTQLRFVANISGFSKEVVRTLMAAMRFSRKFEDVNGFPRVEAFKILNGLNLEQLNLIFNDDDEYSTFSEKYMEFLQEYVFNSFQNLKVKQGKE